MSARAARTGATAYNPREVEEALHGHTDLPPERLVALICATNPTGRGLSRDDTARRYELKSALQSRLIERHGGEVGLVEDGRDGFVLLRHRPTGLSASHARVESLSPRARAWVRLQLDLRTDHVVRAGGVPVNERAPRRPDPRPRPAAARDPLAEAAAAAARFDYERAGSLLRKSFGERGGDVATARALVGFLVEEVALYADALALEDACGEDARRDDVVRGRWAFAASQLGDEAAALRHVAGLAGEGAAAVFVALARASLGRGALDDAVRHAVGARRLQPAAAGLADVEARLSAALAGRLRAEEDAADEALARGDVDGAEALARAVLQRWPESPRARAVARSVRDARRARAVTSAAAAFEDALARGELTEAARHLAAMREHAADVAPYVERVERAKADRTLAARAQEEAAAAAVVASIGPSLAAWAPAFLALSPAAREAVRRSDAARPWGQSLAACEALTAGGDVSVGRAVEAATALQRATELAARDPDGAARLLAGYERVLDRAPETQGAMQQVFEARRARAVASAEEAVARAEAERAAGRWEEALAALDGVAGPGALPAALRARADGARAALTKALAYEREAGVRPAAGSLEGAVRALDAIGAAAHAPWALGAATRWAAAREALRALAAARWPVAVVSDDAEGARPTACTLPLPTGGIAPALPSTRWLFAMSVDRVVTLCDYDLAGNEVAARVALPAGAPLREVTVEADEESVALRGASGVDLILDRRTWAVRDVVREEPAAREGYAATARVTWPGCPWRWTVATNGTHFACERMDGARSFACALAPVPVRGHGPPRMFVRSGERDWALVEAEGDAVMRWRAPGTLHVVAAAPAPGGDGWVVVVRETELADREQFEYTVRHLRGDGRGLAVVARFPCPTLGVGAYTSADGCCWVVSGGRAATKRLIALRADEGGGVVEAWRHRLSPNAVVVPVEGGARAVLALPSEGAFVTIPLTAEPPPTCGEPEAPSEGGPRPSPTGPLPEEVEVFMNFLRAARLDRSQLARLISPAHVSEMIARCNGSAAALVSLAAVYFECQQPGGFARVTERLDALAPGDARVALLRARWDSENASPEAALAAAAKVSPAGLSARDRRALLLLRMKAHVERGEQEAAAALLPDLKEVAAAPEYAAMKDACEPLPEALDLEEQLAAPGGIRRRRALIELADRALAAGDARSAFRAIVGSGVYRSADHHANGRACRAILTLLDGASPAERVDYVAFLSRYASGEAAEHGGLGSSRYVHPSRHLDPAEAERVVRDANDLLSLVAASFGA